MKKNLTIPQLIITRASIVIGIIIIIFPILAIFSIAFRRPDSIYQAYLFFIPKHFSLQNFILAKDLFGEYLGLSMARMFFNSILVTVISIAIALVITALSSFSFSNYMFKGREFLFILLISGMMIPYQIVIIPLYLQLNKMQLLNSYFALIFTYVTFNIPIAILIFRRFFEEIPKELRDAARIDGASDIRYFLRIVIPLSKPAIATVIIFLFLNFWNEFLFARIFIRDYELQTIPVVISRIGLGGTRALIPWGTYTAAIVIVIVPIMIVFFALQKWFIRGITMGALKG
ncbi:MAG: carbohydrate ABC transporter permease [Actinobacteria bacterium]|nr:carbohydrate ABC transporter permease [Actinomycetota bacterium]